MKKNFLLAIACASALAGCANEELRQSQAALETAIGGLGACRAELSTCHQSQRTCSEARDTAEASLAECSQKATAAQGDVQSLETRADELRSKLQSEIAAKNVEIESLRGKLSLRMLDRILFKSGSAEILPEGKAALDKVAAVLASTPELIRVEGHTDRVPVGGALKQKYPSNWELSSARASSVVRHFEEKHKLDPKRLEAVGYAQHHPVATGDTPEDLQRNRRVEIVLTSPREAAAQ